MNQLQQPPNSDFSLLKQDIARQADLFASDIPKIRKQVAKAVGDRFKHIERIYLTGCGDSFNVGMATRWVWEDYLKIPVEALPAMTFSRFAVHTAPPGSLVVALSQSGRVNRVVEAIRAARQRGLMTLSVTGSADSLLGMESVDSLVITKFPKLGFVPGTTSYAHGLIIFYELVSALSSDAARARNLQSKVDELPKLIEAAIEKNKEVVIRHAATFTQKTPVLILASGPQLANAKFTSRKLYEITQSVALSQESEEYAHDEYSIINSDYSVLLFAPPDRGFDRHVELAHFLDRLGVHLAVVTSSEKADAFTQTADTIYEIPQSVDEISPVLYAIPPQILIAELAERIGGSYYCSADRIHAEDGDPQIYQSAILPE